MKRINLSTAFSGIKFNSKKLLFFIIALFSMFSCLVEEEIPETNFEVTIETVDASSITDSSAIVGVIISSNDKSQVSLTIGVCLNTTGNPTTSDLAYEGSGELGQFTVKITELNAATKYYARAYVTNAAGTTLYGNEVYFTTMPKNAGTVTDADGNVYQTVKIGSQIWMVENLKTTKYNDGTSIPYVTVDATWVSQTTPAYCWLSNSAVNYKESYGALYNWYAVNTGKLAPAGWHVPTDADWTELTTYLGGEIDCAGQLKDKGTALWLTPNTGANNISGFTGRPGGSRSNDGLFYGVGGYGYWWTSTEGNAAGGWGRSLTYNTTTVGRLNYYKGCGFSVRCIKGDPLGFPVLTTTDISSISTTSASSGGNITSDGGSTITARGVCWSTKTNPIITDTTKTTNGAGIGNFISTISGLKASTTYYVRAYATNTMGTAYGNEVSFTTSTPVGLPTLSTTTPTSITSTSAAGGGNITSDGGLIVTARGICWSTAVNPTVLLTTKTSNGTGIGTFTSSMTGLTANTTYYVRAYATNSAGTAYGTQLSFTTTNVAAALPTVSTTAISSILTTSATSGGNITADGGATVTVKGVCWSTTATPTIANSKTSDGIGTGTFTSSITGLTANTTYYVRAYATNSVGTSYGNEVSFKTASVTNNLLTNYDFETWSAGVPTGWTLTTTTGGTVTQSTTTPTGSGSSFQIAGPTATYSISQVIPPPAGASTFDTNKTYKISVKYLAKAGDGTDARVWSSFVTSAVGVTPLVYYITPTSHLDSVLSYYSLHGPGGYRTLSAGVFGDDYNTYLLDNRISGLWHTYSCLFKFPAGITQFGFMVRTYSASTVIWDDMYFGEYDGVSPTSGFMGTSSISGVTATSATSGGYFVNDGGSSIITRGVCWSTAPNPTISNSKTVDGNGTNTYTSSITGLTLNTTYYVRAYATNSVGTCYGDEQIFKTSIVSTVPVISTTAVSAITATTATSGGNVTSDGGASVTARGVCWSTSTGPTIANSKTIDGAGIGEFNSNITGLSKSTYYYVRAYATNSVGTSYGNEVSFKTSIILTTPTITTSAVSAITATTATGGGNVTSDGGATVTARGVCWSTASNPTTANSVSPITSGTGSFVSGLTGLTANTTYYVRAFATNSVGTAYGNEVSFKTLTTPTGITDIDGNVYTSVTIGTQTWMVENLKTTKYNDGTAIPLVTDGTAWVALATPGYCWYNNDAASNKTTYGAMYNWYAVNNAKLAPAGWHVATDAEWTTLESYVSNHLGTSSSVAKALAAKTNWASYTSTGTIGDNITLNNSSGFSALPGGYRYYDGTYDNIGYYGYWWSSTEGDTTSAWLRYLTYHNSYLYRNNITKSYGFSVRCVRDY